MTLNALPVTAGDTAAAGNPGHDAASPRAHWSFARAGARDRAPVEAFIRHGFERAYGARLARLMPTLMALRRDAEIAAACGLRAAAVENLFLETYLDQPVEAVLSAATGLTLGRPDIIEVGNLVIARAGFARRLIFNLTTHLNAAGPAWVVFTAVPALRNNFMRMGIPLVTLAPADGGRLPGRDRAEWGHYYDQAPLVTAVRVASAFNAVCEAACAR